MNVPTRQQYSWAHELDDLMHGASGGFLFSIPLLYTMEIWWLGTYITPPRMAAALFSMCVIVFLLNLIGGFRKARGGRLSDTLIETIQAVGFSLLFSAGILLLLRRVTFETSLDAAVGKIIYGALPFAIGMALGDQVLSGERDVQAGEQLQGAQQRSRVEGKHTLNATISDLGASAIGAVFVAFPIAPTEEIPMLVSALSPPWLLGVVAASLLVSYMIVFESSFSDAQKRWQQRGVLQSPPSETVASYLVALVASVLMLVLYDQVGLDDPWHIWLSHTIVLGLPAAVGGAAGRLAV